MNEFSDNHIFYKHAKRGSYIIFPLKYDKLINLVDLEIADATPMAFDSDNFSGLLTEKCKISKGFVRRYHLNNKPASIHFKDEETEANISVNNAQLIVFNNRIAFVSYLLTYDNDKENEVEAVYKYVNPGYVNDQRDDIRKDLLRYIQDIHSTNTDIHFQIYAASEDLAIKETYLFNVAIVSKRFDHLDTLERLAFNAHKMIDISEDFKDSSEKDIVYTYGARDVTVKTYRWCACISSQSISYIYADTANELNIQLIIDISKDDLLLTLLVLHQKSTCMLLNEQIQYAITKKDKSHYYEEVTSLKKEALEFKASGTLAPSQVSRWYNVCETYRNLLEVNGIRESIDEVEQKIELIKDELERRSSDIQSRIGTFITIFGVISIIASILTIVDLLGGNQQIMIIVLSITIFIVSICVYFWIKMIAKK